MTGEVRCIECGTKMEHKEIDYENKAWHIDDLFIIERADALICPNCGETAFTAAEVKRLQYLAKNYILSSHTAKE